MKRDQIATGIYWIGLGLLIDVLLIAATSSHPSAMNHNARDWIVIACGLISFTTGGLLHFFDWGKRAGRSSRDGTRSLRDRYQQYSRNSPRAARVG